MKNKKLFHLVLAAVFAALTCVATMVVNIPIPATKGYLNLGDCIVLLGAFFLGPVYGMAAGGVGSMLADLLLGYAVYAPGTLVIKGVTALLAGLILRALGENKKPATLLAGVVGEAFMVGGYFAYESLVLGYGFAAAASVPANAVQGAAGLVLSAVLYRLLIAVPQIRALKT